MIPIPPLDLWPLDAFVEAANSALPEVLPDAPVVRIERTVTPRLVRYLATQGVISEPHKAGREARYDRRHLAELLAVRRLMALGHTISAIGTHVRTASDAALDDLVSGGDATPGLLGLTGPDTGSSPTFEPNPTFASLGHVSMSMSPPPDAVMAASEDDALAAPASEGDVPGRSALDFLLAIGHPPAAASHAPPPSVFEPSPAFKRSPRPGTLPERWHRLAIAPGIDLHVRDDARLPLSPAARARFLRTIEDALSTLPPR